MARRDRLSQDNCLKDCLDELTGHMMDLRRHDPAMLAAALRVHLQLVLRALLHGKLCTRKEIRDFVRELERDALQHQAE